MFTFSRMQMFTHTYVHVSSVEMHFEKNTYFEQLLSKCVKTWTKKTYLK